jgi:hypothetical protein
MPNNSSRRGPSICVAGVGWLAESVQIAYAHNNHHIGPCLYLAIIIVAILHLDGSLSVKLTLPLDFQWTQPNAVDAIDSSITESNEELGPIDHETWRQFYLLELRPPLIDTVELHFCAPSSIPGNEYTYQRGHSVVVCEAVMGLLCAISLTRAMGLHME